MLQKPRPDPALLRALDYTEEDLLANRAGTLTARQQQRIATYTKIGRCGTRMAIIAGLGSVALLFAVALFTQDEPGFQQAWPYLLLAGLLFLGIFGGFVALGMLRIRKLGRSQVQLAEGPALLTTQTLRNGRWTAYYLTIDGVRFQLASSDQLSGFTEGAPYRVYYLHYPPTQIILSVE